MTDSSKRKLVKALATGGGVVAVADQWAKPMVDGITLPAHAVTTGCEDGTYSGPTDGGPPGCFSTGGCVSLMVDCGQGTVDIVITTTCCGSFIGTATISDDSFSGPFSNGAKGAFIDGTLNGDGTVTGNIFGGDCEGPDTYTAPLNAVCIPTGPN